MFYVVDGATLRKWFMVMLAAILVLWLFWQILIKVPVLQTENGVLVRGPIQGTMEVFRPFFRRAPKQKEKVPEAPQRIQEVPVDPPPLEPKGEVQEDGTEGIMQERAETGINVDEIDEYLPAAPVFSHDLQFALPASGGLLVAVEPLTKREAFAEFRWERERSRSRQLETMTGILSDGTSSDTQKASAQARIMEIMAGSELEGELEGLLMAQGLPDAVVIVGDKYATVMVDTVLTEEEAARIGDTVSNMTGVSLEEIKILDQRS